MFIRRATPSDADAIGALHAESWRRAYRGMYTDAYLDGDVVADRLAVWRDRFAAPDPDAITIVLEEDGELIGFAHTILDSDPTWGALLDNLHVAPDLKGRGLGRVLMRETAAAVLAAAPASRLFLWVLEQNVAAQGFYRHLGGVVVGQEESDAPGGGRIIGLRVVWDDPAILRGDDTA